MSAFERLSGALQYQVASTLGFRELRPVQEQAIEVLLDGKNAVVLAPTAGGKTEAAFFPVLSAMDAEDWKPVSVLYLSPIRALLNNQEDRIARYAGTIGRRVFKWHGDTAQSARKRFLAEPTDILLITPESLEAMLISARIPTRELFAGLRAVIIDEIHAFASDDRGAHLSALMERLTRFCGRDVQRIGLSATVGNPDEILRWVQGSSQRPSQIVDPGAPKPTLAREARSAEGRGLGAEPHHDHARRAPELSLDFVGNVENAARVVQALHPGRKRLVFVDSRRQAEQLGNLLRGLDVMTFVTHGSLSATERRDAERAFQDGKDCVIVATSALELGIDVGDLDHVLQLDAPPSVASFLQRMGRTGRRGGAANCTFLATKDTGTLQAAAIIQLFREGYVEPVRPSRTAFHILAHQIMGLAVQHGGLPRGDLWGWLDGASAFAGITPEEREQVVDHMLQSGILADQGGKLWLGPEGEKRYGRANFRELYAVFDTPRLITVRSGPEEVGTVDAQFLAAIDSEAQRGAFMLAGRAWQIVTVEWERGICVVKPAESGRAPRWSGGPRFLGYALCKSMRRVLVSDAEDPAWSQRARRTMTTLRAEYAFLDAAGAPLLESGDQIEWWTFGGGGANLLLARMLEAELGEKVTSGNTSIRFKEKAGESVVAVRQAIDAIAERGGPTEGDAARLAIGATRGRLSKFDACLPEEMLGRLIVEAVLDVAGARGSVAAVGLRGGASRPSAF
jgi:ATP-dependent helicase Lhr and Lhr-like helicase